MWVDLKLGEAFALVCHIDFSLEIFSSFILYSYCLSLAQALLVSLASNLFYLQPCRPPLGQCILYWKIDDLLLACSIDKPEVFCPGFKALYNRISILPAPPTFLVFLNRKPSTPTTMLVSPMHPSPCPSYFLSLSILPFLLCLLKTSGSALILPRPGAVLKLLYSENQIDFSELQRVSIILLGIWLYMVI